MSGDEKAKVVKNASSGYGYKYSNLADLAKAGVEIPKMRTKAVFVQDGVGEKYVGDYLEYLDENGEWQTGAKIIIPEMKGMNAAQAYGSALTYARRYTVQLAKSVACDDDDAIEKNADSAKKAPSRKLNFVAIKEHIATIEDEQELLKYWESLNLTEKQEQVLKKAFTQRRKEINDGVGR